MRAARYYGVGDVRIEEVAKPVCGPLDVLVRVAFAGICGSDLHVYGKGMFGVVPPMTMGHEFSGVVEAVGDSVESLRPGNHVVGDPRIGCGHCEWCARGAYHLCADLAFVGEARPGSYAEYIVLPEAHLVTIPESLDLRLAALVEPMAVAVHAVNLIAGPRQTRAGIIGAGPIGLLTLVAARSRTTWRISVADRIATRRDRASLLGAAEVVEDLEDAGERWADAVFEAAGKQAALIGGLRWLRPEGIMAMIGIYEEAITLDPTEAVVKEARIVGVSAYGREDLVEAAALLAKEATAASQVVSDVIPLERAAAGLEASRSSSAAGKVLLDCG
jgi:2-desacetyl-2-hydroxyethyl bacteriochlorophyllide A dehydrogenase